MVSYLSTHEKGSATSSSSHKQLYRGMFLWWMRTAKHDAIGALNAVYHCHTVLITQGGAIVV